MGLGRAYSVALVGLNGYIVEVEADIGQTLPAFVILGLPDASLNEAKERIRSAAQNSGIPLSRRKITANLIPASLPKRGSGFDLAIAMAALYAADDIRTTGRTVFIAELGLDGRLRPIRGVLPAVMAAVQAGYPDVVVAQANAAEAALVPGARVQGYRTLARLAFDFGADPQELALDFEPQDEEAGEETDTMPGAAPDMCDVAGQGDARRALEVAAAGAHHLLLTGPPGAGKTMLAERLPGLLPDLGDTAAMEVTAIHSLCALPSSSLQLVRRPPFENPHHTATSAAIIGGGTGLPRPGAASRAHRGILFLDEASNLGHTTLLGQQGRVPKAGNPAAIIDNCRVEEHDALQPMDGGASSVERWGSEPLCSVEPETGFAINPKAVEELRWYNYLSQEPGAKADHD